MNFRLRLKNDCQDYEDGKKKICWPAQSLGFLKLYIPIYHLLYYTCCSPAWNASLNTFDL